MSGTTDRARAWEQRYQAGELRWDKGEPAPGLVDFLKSHPALPRGSVLVPGCGIGHDARAWAAVGFAVTAMDIAPTAIRLARAQTPPALANGIDWRVADFLSEPAWRRFDWLFEHTLFCAINPTERPAYVEAAARWVRPGGWFLAIHYLNPASPDGPPFGVSREELRRAFTRDFELLEAWVPRSFPNREGREWMAWWRRKV